MPSGIYKHSSLSEIAKRKINIALRGRKKPKRTEEHKKKISETIKSKRLGFTKGYIPWNKGLKGWNAGAKHPSYGKKLSVEHKRKISSKLKGNKYRLGKKSPEYEIVRLKGIDRSYYKKISVLGIKKQQNHKQPTSIEKIVYDYLESKKIDFERQKLINGKFLVDAFIPKKNLVIEVDGTYWHSLDRVKSRDRAKNAYLLKCGFTLLRLKEEEIRNGSFVGRMVV